MIDTASVTLDIPLHPIRILLLSDTGIMPHVTGEMEMEFEHRIYQPLHLPPRNRTEGQLLSVWINTHQAMFMTISMSAYAVSRALQALARRELSGTIEWLNLAGEARLASAAYTDLPALTQPLYESYVRESMKLVHPGFSGVSNLESIRMELALRELKQAFLACQRDDQPFAQSIAGAHEHMAQADQFWWISHGRAMRRMVRETVSLARMDAQKKARDAGEEIDFEEYREKILREPKALTEYDGYFAVERRAGLTLDRWRNELARVLATADDYVASTGPAADRSKAARPYLFHLMDLARGEETSDPGEVR